MRALVSADRLNSLGERGSSGGRSTRSVGSVTRTDEQRASGHDPRKVERMYMLAVNHNVQNYDRWKAVFDEFPPSKGGAKFYRVNRNIDDPNNITVVSGFETTQAVLDFTNNP